MDGDQVPTALTLSRVVVRKWPRGSDPERDPPAEVIEMTYDNAGGALVWVTERIYRQGELASVRRFITVAGG